MLRSATPPYGRIASIEDRGYYGKKVFLSHNSLFTKIGVCMSNLEDPRVLFAAERTLLAWNRTNLALAAFGFMIERSGVLIRALQPKAPATPDILTFWVGLVFILLGAFCAFYSALQYGAVLRTMTRGEIPQGYPVRWGMAVNWIVAALATTLALVLGVYAMP